jgi:hypothetical protein
MISQVGLCHSRIVASRDGGMLNAEDFIRGRSAATKIRQRRVPLGQGGGCRKDSR